MCSKYSIIDINTKKTIIDNIEIIKNTKIYRTDKQGSIKIELNKKEYEVSTYNS